MADVVASEVLTDDDQLSHAPPPHHVMEMVVGDGGDTDHATTNDAQLTSDDAAGAAVSGGDARSHQQRVVRGRYAKFTANMDVVMLETLLEHNPFVAKHGTRLQMWQIIAETVGQVTQKNPEAYSWHTCRDRVTTLMKLFADGKHDKLFKHGTVEENVRKEAMLGELQTLLSRRGARPGGSVRAPTALEVRVTSSQPQHGAESTVAVGGNSAAFSVASGNGVGRDARHAAGRAPNQHKRRRVDVNGYPGAGRGVESGSIDTEAFRVRVLELMETKIQFDMEQRVKENELREQEFELQKRFLEYLQSK